MASIKTQCCITWVIHYILQGCVTIGSSNCIYVFNMFVNFTLYTPWVYFYWGLLYIFLVLDLFFRCTFIISVLLLICLYIVYIFLHLHVCLFLTICSLFVLRIGNFSCVSPVHGLFYHCVVITYVILLICWYLFYICLIQYSCVLYTLYSLFLIRLGNILMNIYCIWFILTLKPTSYF